VIVSKIDYKFLTKLCAVDGGKEKILSKIHHICFTPYQWLATHSPLFFKLHLMQKTLTNFIAKILA